MLVPHEERVGPWRPFPHNGWADVRVWERQTPFGFFQRHEWRGEGRHQIDDWIPAVGRRQFSSSSAKTNETLPSETDLLLEAVLRIAAGHNDPRTLALEILTRIKDAA